MMGDVRLSSLFELALDVDTRGRSVKLAVPVCHTDFRSRSVRGRCVRMGNSLPAYFVDYIKLD